MSELLLIYSSADGELFKKQLWANRSVQAMYLSAEKPLSLTEFDFPTSNPSRYYTG